MNIINSYVFLSSWALTIEVGQFVDWRTNSLLQLFDRCNEKQKKSNPVESVNKTSLDLLENTDFELEWIHPCSNLGP